MAYPHSPLVAFVVGLVAVILLLVYWDLPAFIGLVIATFVVGLVAPQVAFGNIASETAAAFGEGMTGIGIPILMAAVIGKSMMGSGAAERIVRGFRGLTGSEGSVFALWGSSSFLAIPVFFDNVFYLMAPLARSMRARVGKNYALYLVVVGAGAATTHVFVPPTPGPLAVADEIGVNLGMTIIVGLIVAIPSALVAGIFYGRWINARLDIPLRDSMDTSGAELEDIAHRSTNELPGMFEASLPILLAVVLVASNTIVDTFLPEDAPIGSVTSFLGDPNFALTMAAIAAALTFRRMRAMSDEQWSDELTESLKSGGNIAAITAAGGAFGAMLAAAGIGDYIADALAGLGIGLLVTAWLIAAAVRIAQGSATVAMLTTAGIVSGSGLVASLSVHPAYLVMAIGAGGNIFSWYNDSGFWLVKEIGGLTQAETLKTWTALTTIISVTGLITVLIASTLVPLT
ncbi:gluconate:H+ symporter, GntP family [Haladaptatus litoreus]|uniref:Gluconate:H+ symporter, GntP family n=1 Tax=Haladaptatus litoreus TaxID=553468 RepID=A0A1N6ZVK8_9EURY|nr:gluconate:H+ symporter [Haladaptatus litoreus]SIR30811.1 gluconate:H+ symporter, GntP family [Haladaptatus litoreus]